MSAPDAEPTAGTMAFDAADGTRLAFRDEGSGPPVLCLAGLTRDGRDFDYLAPHLPGVRLIRLDSRGRGASAWADPATYTVPQEATDAVALLDHLGVERAAVLGTSRGGLIAMVLAARARDRLSGACLVDIGPEIGGAGLEVIMGYLGLPPPYASLEEAAAARPSVMTGFEGVPESRWREEVAKFLVGREDGTLTIPYDPRLRDALIVAGAQPTRDLWPLFVALPEPLAAIRGANSDLLSEETFAVMRARRPDMIAGVVPGRGHVPFLDEPESLEVIRAWTSRL